MKVIFPNVGVLPEYDAAHLRVVDAGSGSTADIAIAVTAVPDGVPYRVVQDNDIPGDRTYRNAWEADFSTPDGIGGR
jgi:hypothetical protein